MENSTVSGNTVTDANGSGGGIYLYDTMGAKLRRSTISGNTAPDGGGVALYLATAVMLENATVAENSATTGDGGGLLLQDTPSGVTSANIRLSTIANNDAHNDGGGI